MIEGHTWHVWKEALLIWAHRNHVSVPAGFDVNAERCGTQCEELLKDFQRHSGLAADGVLGPLTAAKLSMLIGVQPHPSLDARQRIVHEAHVAVAFNAIIHYPPGDVRTMTPLEINQLWVPGNYRPISADCSEMCDVLAHAAGLVDQTGTNWGTRGPVYTGTFLSHLAAISMHEAQMGDFGIFGAETGTHVVMLLETPYTKQDPMVFSHGFEGGPQALPLLQEAVYHPGQELRWRRLDTHHR